MNFGPPHPPFGQPPPGMPRPLPGMSRGYGPPPGMPYPPPFQQAPPILPPAVRPFQSPPMYAPRAAGAPVMYQPNQQVYHAAPVLKPPPPAVPEVAPTTIYVGNITDRYPDFTVAEVLSACGAMLAWKRVKGHDFKLQAFGFCEFEKPDGAARASRLLNELLLGNDRKLVVKIDAKTQERIDEWLKNKCLQSGKRIDESDQSTKFLDDKTLIEDRIAKEKIAQIVMAANAAADEADANKPAMAAELPKKTMHGLDVAEDRRHIITKEIKHFRGSDEKSSKSSKSTTETISSPNAEGAQPRSPSRQRDEAAASSGTGGTAAAPAEPPVDEEEAAERRRAERRAREKAERYAERLKSWESRERERGRQYARTREKETDTKRKQENEKNKLKEFLEDYDDVRDDSKYYRGSALAQRLKDREREIESDSRDRKREKDEMEDVRRKLRDQGCRNLDEEIEKLERASTEHLLPRLRGDENSPASKAEQAGKTGNPSPHSDSTPSLDQHIQLLSSKLNRQDGDMANADEGQSMDDTGMIGGGRQFVPARFEPAADSSAALPSPQQPSRKRPESMTVDEERAELAGNTAGGDAATLSLKLSLSKAKRLAAAISVVAEMGQSSSGVANTGMNRLGPMVNDGDSAGASSSNAFMSEESKRERIQQLIQSIPSAKNDLFAYNLDWGVVDKLLMEKRVRPWIDKKIVEYIGEKEPTLSEFLCQKVLARTAPEKILEDISVIFDEDAELFVVKLWRLLIYETEARKLKINQF